MVFISYSHDSDAFCDKVLELSTYLRTQGIDCNIDQYEESPAEGWPRWMEKQIRESEYVIVVCTCNYYEKSVLRTSPESGLGVKWESNLILNYLYNQSTVSNKFIPVVFDNDDVITILEPLKGFTYYNLQYDEKKKQLCNRLKGIKNTKKVPLGKIESQPKKNAYPDARMLITTVVDVDVWNNAKWIGMGYFFDFKNEPYLGFVFENIIAGKKIFTDWKYRFSATDSKDEIYISIIEEDGGTYQVHLGTNLQVVYDRMESVSNINDLKIVAVIDRWHRMTITKDENLKLFKNEFDRAKKYKIIPIYYEGNKMIPLFDYSIDKQIIRFREIVEIVNDDEDYDALALKIKYE